MKWNLWLLGLCCWAATAPLLAQTMAERVLVEQAWVRQPPPNVPAAGAFMTLRNPGQQEIQLVGASNGASVRTELHTHLHEDGMMKMRKVAFIPVKPGGETQLNPGGYHIMLLELTQTLKDGDKIPFTLEFQDGSRKTLALPVKRPGGGY